MKKGKENRRSFLNSGLKGLLATGAVLGSGAVLASAGKRKIKCLTQDGELVEVEIDDENDSISNPVSNEELKNWINKKQKS